MRRVVRAEGTYVVRRVWMPVVVGILYGVMY